MPTRIQDEGQMAASRTLQTRALVSLMTAAALALPASAERTDARLVHASASASSLQMAALMQSAAVAPALSMSSEQGIASWYGRAFQGRPTASGELFDANIPTAAHPSLPLPSLVKVTNQQNGREIVVRVNDRGPFTGGRIIDLSRRAAETLGMIDQGTASVKLDYLGPAPELIPVHMGESIQAGPAMNKVASEPKPAKPAPKLYDDRLLGGVEPSLGVPDPGKKVATPARLPDYSPPPVFAEATPSEPVVHEAGAAESGPEPLRPQPVAAEPQAAEQTAYGPQVYVQVGSFTRINNAEAVSSKLNGRYTTDIESVRVDEADYFRVFAGPFATRSAGEQARQDLQSLGLGEGFLVLR